MVDKLEKLFLSKRKSKAMIKVNSNQVSTNNYGEPQGFIPAEFDFQNNTYAMTVYDDVNQTYYTSYYVNQNGYNVVNNSINYSLIFLPDNNNGLLPILLQTNATTLDTYTTSFYDLNNTFIMDVNVSEGVLSGVNFGVIPESNGLKRFFNGWGNCFLDVYSGHGGASALAVIASVVAPPSIGYFIFRCAAVNVHLL